MYVIICNLSSSQDIVFGRASDITGIGFGCICQAIVFILPVLAIAYYNVYNH